MSDIQALQAELTQQSGALRARQNSFMQNGESIRAIFQQLRIAWEGDASLAFQEGASTWEKGYQQAVEAFKRMNDQFETARNELHTLEQSNTNRSSAAWS